MALLRKRSQSKIAPRGKINGNKGKKIKAPTPVWELIGHYGINFVFISHFKGKLKIAAAAPPPISHK